MKVFSKTVTQNSSARIKFDSNHQILQASQITLRHTEKWLFGRVKRIYEVSSDGGNTWSTISRAEYERLLATTGGLE